MDTADHLRTLETESAALVAAIAGDPDAPITHCGDWTNRGLGAHIGAVWTIAGTNVRARVDEPTPPGDERRAPEDPDALVDWLEERRAFVLAELAAADPGAPAWSFHPGDHTAGFWQRRMANETLIHRWDAQSGAGSPDPISSQQGREGIDEYTTVGLRYSSGRPDRVYPVESLHLHCTDTEGEWMLVGDGGRTVTVTSEHGKGDAAVRGPAGNLLLWVWGRPGGPVEIFGDERVAAVWRALAP